MTGPPVTANVQAGSTPAGFVRINYGDASVAVPAGWTLLSGGESVCPEPNNVVLLGTAETAPCSQTASGVTSCVRLAPRDKRSSGGASVEVNGHSGWPIHQLGPSDMIPGSCGPELQTPQVLEGEGGIVSGCPASLARVTAGTDSLWIHPAGSNPPAGTQPIRPSDPEVLVIPDTVAPQVQPVLHLLVKPAANEPYVAVDIGLGSQTATSQQILASLSNTPYLLPAIHRITG